MQDIFVPVNYLSTFHFVLLYANLIGCFVSFNRKGCNVGIFSVVCLGEKCFYAVCYLFQLAEERISNIRTVRSFTKEKLETERYNKSLHVLLTLAKKQALATAVYWGSVS